VLRYSEFLESLRDDVLDEMMDMIDDDPQDFPNEILEEEFLANSTSDEVDYDNMPDHVLEEMSKSDYGLMVESGDIPDDV
jgi:hypothetical protein